MNELSDSKRALRRRRRKKYLRNIIAAVKNTRCADCAKKYPTRQMTFDHLPEYEKRADIGYFVSMKSRRALLIEMAKCAVVCRPCHDIREIKRRNKKKEVEKEG